MLPGLHPVMPLTCPRLARARRSSVPERSPFEEGGTRPAYCPRMQLLAGVVPEQRHCEAYSAIRYDLKVRVEPCPTTTCGLRRLPWPTAASSYRTTRAFVTLLD
jgi:hypothetical protein